MLAFLPEDRAGEKCPEGEMEQAPAEQCEWVVLAGEALSSSTIKSFSYLLQEYIMQPYVYDAQPVDNRWTA